MLARNLKRIKLITFDCTNTLFYFKCPPEEQYLKTAHEMGIDRKQFDATQMTMNFRKHFKDLHDKYPNFARNSIGLDYLDWWKMLVRNVLYDSSTCQLDHQKIDQVAMKLISQYKTKECWGKFEKSNELIESIKSIGVLVGIISNFDIRLHDLLKDMELPKIDFVVTSYEADAEKPDPKIFQYALSLANKLCNNEIRPNQCLHIGNELIKDYEGARNSGWKAVLINSDTGIHEQHFVDVEHFLHELTTKEIEL